MQILQVCGRSVTQSKQQKMTIDVPIVTCLPRLYQPCTNRQKQSNSKNDHWCTNHHMSTQSPPNTQSPPSTSTSTSPNTQSPLLRVNCNCLHYEQYWHYNSNTQTISPRSRCAGCCPLLIQFWT